MRTLSPNSLAIIGAVVWMILVALVCGIVALMVIGRAFSNKTGGGLADLILAPGLRVADGNLAIVLIASWVCWVIAGLILIVVARFISVR